MKRNAFSLTEMLVVMAVISVLAALVAPALSSVNSTLQLNRAASEVGDTLNLGRSISLGRNVDVAFRIYQEPGTNRFRSFRLVQILETGEEKPLSRVQVLPAGMSFAATEKSSSLLAVLSVAGPEILPGNVAANYLEFRFRPGGFTDLDPGLDWFLTVMPERDLAADSPANYVTFVVDPNNGITRSYRP